MKIYSPISLGMIALGSIVSCNAFAVPEYKSKLSGFEFGAGVPLVTPLTGYNVFVGYVNKNASTFLGRRFGIRADFTVPSDLRLGATVSDDTSGDKYDLNIHGKVLGFDVKQSDFSDKDFTMDRVKDDADNPISIGADAVDAYVKIHNKNMGVLVDFYPFADTWFLGGIRFSGGYYIGDLDVSARARINNDIEYKYGVGHAGDYLRAQLAAGSRIGADFHWKYHGPYAGVGFDLGIWRGFKFYMDAGVVFSDAPRVSDNNIDDQNFVIQGCYQVNGTPCNDTEMVTILQGANKPEVREIVKNTVGQSVKSILVADAATAPAAQKYLTVINNNFGGAAGVANIDVATLANDIVNFLDDEGTAPWIDDLINHNGSTNLKDSIDDIKSEWNKISDNATDGIQNDINQAWDDYEKSKHDAIDDINDFLDDYGIIPMVKIGFMYRF